MQMLAAEKVRNVSVIGTSSEKFKTITTKEFEFKDSINFLNFSLSDLVENLKNKVERDEDYRKLFPATFSLVKDKYSTATATAAEELKLFKMLIRKQPYPYVTIFLCTTFPPHFQSIPRNISTTSSSANLKNLNFRQLRHLPAP